MKTLYSLAGLDTALELGPLNNLLNRLFGDLIETIQITDFFESEENGVRSYTVVLAVEQSLFFTVPGLDVLTLGVVRESEDEWPLILCELVVDGAPQQLTIRHFPLRVSINNPYLVPIPPEDDTDLLPGFSFELEATMSINTNLDLRAELTQFSLPPFAISGTGLVLGLQACRIITAEEDVDSAITDLGFNHSFRGIAAASAQFYWELPLLIDGMDLPGIRADLTQLAIGNQGLSTNASMSWDVEENGETFIAGQTELLGSLFDTGWQFALEQLNVVIQANNPIGTEASGYLRIPFLNTIIKATLGYRYAENNVYQYHVKLTQKQNVPVSIPLGSSDYELTMSDFLFSGEYQSNGEFSVNGNSRLTLTLPGLNVQADSINLEFEHLSEQDSLRINLENIAIDGFGDIAQAQLVLVFVKDAQGQHELSIFELIVKLQWQDIKQRIQLGQQADFLPLPPDDAEINLNIRWQENNAQFSLQAELDDVDQLWRFIPQTMRPEVADATIEIKLSRTSGAANNDFAGELSLGFLLRLPDLATLMPLQAAGLDQVIEVDTGNEEGWTQLRFKAELESSSDDSNSNNGNISASLENPITLSLHLPGLALPKPPVEISINAIDIKLAADDSDLSGVFLLKGIFQLHPILPDNLNGFVPPSIAMSLNQLLIIASQVDLTGTAELTLGVSADNAYFKAECIFTEAELELDLFDMFSQMLGGSANLLAAEDSATEIDLDIDVSIQLNKISLSLGSEQRQVGQPIPFIFDITTLLGFAGQQADMAFTLSNEHLSFGFNKLTIPIAIPKLPLALSDLDRLKDNNNAWDYDNNWRGVIEPEISTDINSLEQDLAQARDSLQSLRENNADENAIFQLEFRQIPKLQKELFQFVGRKFIYQAILAIHQMLGSAGVAGSQSIYQQNVEIYQAAIDTIFGSLHFDTKMQFEIVDAKFVLPFNNPADIKVEGGASITGFAPDDPLAPLGDVSFKLGISADAIYFSVEGGAAPIPLPDFGRYPGSAINLDRLIIGYGYSKNSLKIDFSGELILAEQLIADADTSTEMGFGIRLPRNNKLQFKLDLIPVVLGEVDFFIPLIAFDIDLRSDNPPPPPPQDGQCRPAWDGLQLIVPDVVKADIKRVKVSPFFGPMPATNSLQSFDIEVGNKAYGLRYICTDYLSISPLLASIPIPFLADAASPFFKRLCINLRLGGFALSFDLTRPFPSPSPLLVFELMGFISDPSVPIDPNGHIADLMYVELYNARITLPPSVQAMFPSLAGVINKDFSGKINIATVIALVQQVQELTQQLLNRLEENTLQGVDWIHSILATPPQISLQNALQLLPDELRQFELEGRFIHFDASVTFMLLQAKDIVAPIGGDTPPVVPTPPISRYQLVYQNNFSSRDLSGWKNFDYGLKRGKGVWQVADNRLLQKNNVGDNSPARYGTMLVNTEIVHADLQLRVDVSSTDNDGLGVVFHVQSKDTFYRFRMTEEQQQWRLVKLVNGRVTTLYKTNDAFQKKIRYQIRIEVSSRASENRGLNHKLSRPSSKTKTPYLIDIPEIVKRVKSGTTLTSIKIWINNQLWCTVEDKKNALSKGYIGFDSWWNNGASFDNIQVFQRLRPELSMGKRATTSELQSLANILSPNRPELNALFSDFSPEDIAAAMTVVDEFAVVVTARVNIINNIVFKMLGAMGSDGSFQLMSQSNVAPISLTVAGIDLPIELNIQSRVTLQGKSAGADSYAQAEALVHGDWIILPASNSSNAIARLILASKTEPASLIISSNSNFALRGNGILFLFAQQVMVTGEINLTQSHFMLAGELEFKPNISLFADTQLMALSLACRGRIGPGKFIALEGEGELVLMGREFSHLSARVNNQSLEISTRLTGNNQSWNIGPLALRNVQMQLQGMVNFNASNPEFAFNGRGQFALFGAVIEGNCRIEANHQQWLLANRGKLFWQGRNWLDGAIVLSNNGVELSGKADFALNLTLPSSIEISGLHLAAAVSGQFNFNNQGQLVNWAFDLNWQLSIKLPDTDDSQVLPIATQYFKVAGSQPGNNGLIELFDLINITDLTLFDLGSITLPLPTLDAANSQGIYLHNSAVNLDVGGITVLTPIDPENGSDPVYQIPGLGFWEEQVNLPEVTLPIPVLSNDPQNVGDDPLFKIPSAELTDTTFPLGKWQLENVNFHLKLAWQKTTNNANGQLGILLVNQKEDDIFIPFEASSLPLIGIGFGFVDDRSSLLPA